MSKLFEEMSQGTAEARAYMEGERKGYKVTLPDQSTCVESGTGFISAKAVLRMLLACQWTRYVIGNRAGEARKPQLVRSLW